MKKIYLLGVAVAMLMAGCSGVSQGIPHPEEKDLSREYSKEVKAAAKECEATISSSGESDAILRCSDTMCQSENPVGNVRKFDCNANDECPIRANTRYNRVCDGLKFASGCSVWYSPVSRCK
ncbi:MAG: hypothetical protein R3D71_10100 [Rickettsiales bacterium]